MKVLEVSIMYEITDFYWWIALGDQIILSVAGLSVSCTVSELWPKYAILQEI